MDIRLAQCIAQGYAHAYSRSEYLLAHQILIDYDLKEAINLRHVEGWSVGRELQRLINSRQCRDAARFVA